MGHSHAGRVSLKLSSLHSSYKLEFPRLGSYRHSDQENRLLWPLALAWPEPQQCTCLQKRKVQPWPQDADKPQEALVTHMTQAASFSKHRWLKPKVPVHWSNPPVSSHSSPVLNQGQMPPAPWLGRQGMPESPLPASHSCMPIPASCQGCSLP